MRLGVGATGAGNLQLVVRGSALEGPVQRALAGVEDIAGSVHLMNYVREVRLARDAELGYDCTTTLAAQLRGHAESVAPTAREGSRSVPEWSGGGGGGCHGGSDAARAPVPPSTPPRRGCAPLHAREDEAPPWRIAVRPLPLDRSRVGHDAAGQRAVAACPPDAAHDGLSALGDLAHDGRGAADDLAASVFDDDVGTMPGRPGASVWTGLLFFEA